MSDAGASGRAPGASPWRPLDARQRRVLGVLLEKAATTPAAYPLTLNAIVTGCNQKNNREPLTQYDDDVVLGALTALQELKAASEIDWLGRVPKYKHHAFEWLGVNRVEMAVMTELLLRGDQPLGELRARAARMAPIEDLAALKPVVEGLRAKGLVIELTAPGRGQVVSHALYLPQERAELEARYGGGAGARAGAPEPPGAVPGTGPRDAEPGGGASAASELAALRAELARLAARVDDLEAKLRGRDG